MPRVKRGKQHVKHRKNILAKTKGYKWGRKNLIKAAKTAINKAGQHAFADRRKKKRNFRALFQIKIGAFAKEHNLSYSKLIGLLKKGNIELDRKVLSDLAENNPQILEKIVEKISTDK